MSFSNKGQKTSLDNPGKSLLGIETVSTEPRSTWYVDAIPGQLFSVGWSMILYTIMDYFYVMSGGFSVRGCAHMSRTASVRFKYAPGDDLFLAYRAKKGILEAVRIKKIIAVANGRSAKSIVPFYVDMNNAIYNEWDLCTRNEAVSLATAYYNKRLAMVDDLINNCTIS